MIQRLALLAALLAAPLLARPALRAKPPATVPHEDIVRVAIDTSAGRMTVALDRGRAPLTVANFLRYVDTHHYDGQSFYRAMRYDKGGLVQAGVTSDARLLFPPVAHEPTSQTGLRNVRGTLAMARLRPGSARGDFFILASDTPSFDAGGEGGDANGFAAFGHVVEGMDVVEKILHAPVSATKGAGVMKGQMLSPVIRIVKAARTK